MALAFSAPFTGVTFFLAMFLLFSERIGREDRMLENRFGKEFRAYRRETSAFFPKLAASRTDWRRVESK